MHDTMSPGEALVAGQPRAPLIAATCAAAAIQSKAGIRNLTRPVQQDTLYQLHRAAHQSPAAPRAPAPLQALFSRQPVETFPTGASVFWEGDAATHVFDLLEGIIRIVKILSGGRRVITEFHYPGDLLGAALEDTYAYTAEAVTPTKLRRIARCHFEAALAHTPELRPYLFARLCNEMAAAQCQLVLLARKTAEERVSSFLLMTARRMNGDMQAAAAIPIPMNRMDVADYLGLTKETVSRAMCRLVSLGVIAMSGRHTVIIREFHSLASHAGDADTD
jgi:CRP/FNR family transcriptional regulator